MHFFDRFPVKDLKVAEISHRMRTFSIIFISVALMAIFVNFYMAGAVYAPATALPFYIFFFMIMFMVGISIDYASLWCKRNYKFHCASVAAHCMALMLVTYETGTFYNADENVYSQPPSYSLTSVLSHIVT